MMAELSIPHPASTSPPPNCAICLGTCTNKCFSDSCMHQFCFTCLLEWSKVKAECPLCKQPFTSIIHNVKSNNEYDEHIVEPGLHTRDDVLNEEYLYLPTTAQPSRHFQFRTTFTVDPRGELAIQQMLLTHRLTNSAYSPTYNYSYRHRHRRDISSTNFRRMVYARNIWVTAPPDITGRYRDISPHFYRENPAAINRLVPWLNRELNALLEENTQQVMILVDVILSHLNRHHIRGFFFKNLLREYLGTRTEHFIHEFYNFMKSPYDMVGYDRHAFYYPRNSFVHTIPSEDTSSSSDSDVTVVATTSAPNPNPFHRPTLEVIEINSDSSRDSDVIIHEPTPPEIVNLINTSDDDVVEEEERAPIAQAHQSHQPRADVETKYESTTSESDHKPKYNPVAAKKEKRNKDKYEKSRKKRKSKISRHIYTSTESENNLSSNSSNYKHYKKRRKQKVKKSNKSKHVAYSESTDDEPLSEKLKKMKESSSRKSKRKDKIRKYYKHKPRFSNSSDEDGQDNKNRNQSTSNYHHYNNHHNQQQPTSTQSSYKLNNYYATVKTDVPSSSSDVSNYRDRYQDKEEAEGEDERNNDSDKPLDFSMAAFAGPSYRSTNSPKIKKERCHLWYSRPRVFESEDDGTSDSDN